MPDNQLKSDKISIPENIKLSSENIEKNQTEVIKTSPEKEKILEQTLEKIPDTGNEGQIDKEKVSGFSGSAGIIAQTNEDVATKAREKKIEKILESGLEETYLKMPLAKQQEFKIVGEVTVKKINGLLNEAKVNINKIIDLIKKWLLIIPGVNKFFLEQEAKIKADEIIKIKNDNVLSNY